MTTLNKTQTGMLKAFVLADPFTKYWIVNDTRIASIYSSLKSDLAAWKSEYDTQSLYGTNADNSTFQFSGIGSFPELP